MELEGILKNHLNFISLKYICKKKNPHLSRIILE